MLQCASLKNISHSWRWQQEEKQRGMVTYQSMSMSGVHGIINQTEILWLFLTSWQTPPCGCPNVSVCQWGKVLDREEQSPSSNPLGVLMFFTDLINMYKYVPLQCPAGGGALKVWSRSSVLQLIIGVPCRRRAQGWPGTCCRDHISLWGWEAHRWSRGEKDEARTIWASLLKQLPSWPRSR